MFYSWFLKHRRLPFHPVTHIPNARTRHSLEFNMCQLDKVWRSFNLPVMTLQIAAFPYKDMARSWIFGAVSHTSISTNSAKFWKLVLLKNTGKKKTQTWCLWLQQGLTSVVAIGAWVRPLALAKAPHGALVLVDTLFIDGIYVVLRGPQGPDGFLTVLTTVGATRAWRKGNI